MRWLFSAVSVAALAIGCAAPGARLPARAALDAMPVEVRDTLALFTSATAMDLAPDGTVYVTDRALDAVVVLGDAPFRRVEGGPGTEEGQFDVPADVDAGNGLVIHVADAGNHRVQRFSREFRHLGSLSVDEASFGDESGEAGRVGGVSGRSATASGRPIGVATSSADELFVVDDAAGVVLKWDEALRPDRIIGDFGSGDGVLERPVDVTTDGDRLLYVVDAGRHAVLIFDLFGSFVRMLPLPSSATPASVSYAQSGEVLVVAGSRVLVLDATGLRYTLAPNVADQLVDAALREGMLYLLTGTALYRTAVTNVPPPTLE